jgi:predicted DNA-binding protein (MmcQ/YjbR family)
MAARRSANPAAALRAYALSLPGAWEDHPWGETVAKVGKKVFVFLGMPGAGLSLTAKLPITYPTALANRFAAPTGYRLGDSGWVTARFEPGAVVPLDLLKSWIDESYRAVAPKRLAAQAAQGANGARPAAARPPPRRTATTRSTYRGGRTRRRTGRPPT